MTDPSSEKKQGTFKSPIRKEAPDDLRRGLNAIETSRRDRNRIKRPSWRVAAWFLMSMAVALVLYFRWESSQVESHRGRILAKQRGAFQLLSPMWEPLRDQLEGKTMELAISADPEVVDAPGLQALEFRRQPGIFLRLRTDQATSVEAIRQGAMGSLRDGFTACLMQNENAPEEAGKACVSSADCVAGELCNQADRCAKPGQPYNVRLAYRALRVFSPEWTDSVRQAPNDLILRGLEQTFESVNSIDFPVAIDLMSKAKFLLIVLDERAAPESDEAADLEAVKREPYFSRVAIYRVGDGKPLLRIRRSPKFDLLGAGEIADVGVAAARERQARSCALALEVRSLIGQ